MRFSSFVPYVFLIGLISCQESKTVEVKMSAKADVEQVGKSSKAYEKFKYGHIRKFTPGVFKGEQLTLIDSTFHNQILNKIEGYSLPYSDQPKNYFISRQNDINGLTAITVSIYWDLCYEGVFLIILDENKKVLNELGLTEWYSSCDLSSSTETTFLNDSIFVMKSTTLEPGEINLIHDFEYKGLINSKGEVDTLKVLLDNKYEE